MTYEAAMKILKLNKIQGSARRAATFQRAFNNKTSLKLKAAAAVVIAEGK